MTHLQDVEIVRSRFSTQRLFYFTIAAAFVAAASGLSIPRLSDWAHQSNLQSREALTVLKSKVIADIRKNPNYVLDRDAGKFFLECGGGQCVFAMIASAGQKDSVLSPTARPDYQFTSKSSLRG